VSKDLSNVLLILCPATIDEYHPDKPETDTEERKLPDELYIGWRK
jgi:hypothetical protein